MFSPPRSFDKESLVLSFILAFSPHNPYSPDSNPHFTHFLLHNVATEARDALKIEQEHLSELFVELQKAFEANDEAKALLLKSEIDRLKEKMIAREQVRQARKDEKTKEKKAAKIAKKAAAAAEKEAAAGKSGAGASKSTAGAAKSGAVAKKGAKTTTSKPVNKKALDTPDTINTKLETRFSLEPSKLLNAPYDPTRKCLVLDIDYTLFDHKWQPQVRSDLRSNKTMIPLFKRPYLHEFLATCNLKYDIIIWSATGMPAIDNKVGNLGIYTSDRYKLTAVLCKDHMIHVTRPRKGGRTYDETVKPLAVIWKKFPEYYNPTNTIHIDDMISNFQLNPLNGIHISPYKESATATLPDTELQYLTKYLMLIAETESDFSRLPHSKWKEWLIDRLWQDSLLTTSLPAHIPDPPIDPALLIAAEMASKSKKKDTSTAVSATSSAASSSAPSAASSATSSAPTNANSTAGSSSSLTASTSPSTDIPRSATPAMNEDAKISTLLSSSPATPTGTPPTTSQLKSATLSRAGSGLAINTALVSTSGPTSPKSPVTSPDGKFPSSPGTLSPSSSLDRLAMAAAIASAGASPSSPSSGTSTPTASTWVRSAFPRPTLSNSLSELPTIVPGTPPSTSPAPISVSTPTAPSSSESNNTSSPTSPALSVSTTATGTPQATTPEKSVPASPTTPPASNLAPSP